MREVFRVHCVSSSMQISPQRYLHFFHPFLGLNFCFLNYGTPSSTCLLLFAFELFQTPCQILLSCHSVQEIKVLSENYKKGNLYRGEMAEWLGRRTSVREYPGSSPGRDVVSKDLGQVLHLYLPPGWLGQVKYVEWGAAPSFGIHRSGL